MCYVNEGDVPRERQSRTQRREVLCGLGRLFRWNNREGVLEVPSGVKTDIGERGNTWVSGERAFWIEKGTAWAEALSWADKWGSMEATGLHWVRGPGSRTNVEAETRRVVLLPLCSHWADFVLAQSKKAGHQMQEEVQSDTLFFPRK